MAGGAAYKVRRFREEDLSSVVEINRKCLPENYSSTFFIDIYRSHPETFLVAEWEGKVVAYIMCRVEHGFSELSRLRIVRKGHIISLAVLPEHRLKGLATLLLVKAMEALHSRYGCSEVYLEVRVSNQPAINLYRKLGFKEAKIINHYYIDGENAFLMARRLPLGEGEEKTFLSALQAALDSS
ncbi:MAG: ribosomal-protein-alanine N-acetyltransferase [Candidatus Hecatellales archaeon]|nr:MAG: ribosomal-protein-alanine N-acetyltransferase [Candidatus Hecatellales archaeon]